MIKRPESSAMDALLGREIPVLDHGFIRVVDYMGNDDAVVQAARVSYGRGTKSASDDRALIRYLMRNRHTTPFEMAEIKLHVRLPIFVARQWIRHRMASVNEYSARNRVLDREFYVPEGDALGAQSTENRQGRGDAFDVTEAQLVANIFRSDAQRAYDHYLELLNQDEDGNILSNTRVGVARELARINLPLSFYTQWYVESRPPQLIGLPGAPSTSACSARNPCLRRGNPQDRICVGYLLPTKHLLTIGGIYLNFLGGRWMWSGGCFAEKVSRLAISS